MRALCPHRAAIPLLYFRNRLRFLCGPAQAVEPVAGCLTVHLPQGFCGCRLLLQLLGLKGCEVLFCLQQVLLGPDTLLAAREPPGLCYLLAQAPALLPPLQLQLQL